MNSEEEKPKQKPPKLTSEQAKIIGKKGGLMKGIKAKERKKLKESLEILLQEIITDKKGIELTVQEAIIKSLVKQAIDGNVKAFETIRDTIGEKPVNKNEVTGADGMPLTAPDIKIIFEDSDKNKK